MLYHLLAPLAQHHIIFNLFRFQTFRLAGAVLTAFLIALWIGPGVIRRLRVLKLGQIVRTDGPQSHLGKSGTPTMGGIMIVAAAVIPTLLWADLTVPLTWVALSAFLWLGLLGFADDYLKITRKNTAGLSARYKLVGQLGLGLLIGVFALLSTSGAPDGVTQLPFLKDVHLTLPFWLYVPFVAFVVTAFSNAVNLTDGLDGLATGLSVIAAGALGVLAYLIGRADTSSYLGFFHLAGAGELGIFLVALAGACMGFLWFNAHPAQVFMGDTGSLAIGGALGAAAVLLRIEFLLAILGGVFVLEAASVAIQTTYFKWTKKRTGTGQRVFRMAPLHHHFEQKGWHENQVIIRFWILGILFALVAFMALKIR